MIRRSPCTAGGSRYDDHRMATAGAVLGLVVARRRGRRRRHDGKETLPQFVALWDSMLKEHGRVTSRRRDLDEDDVRVRPGSRQVPPRSKERRRTTT